MDAAFRDLERAFRNLRSAQRRIANSREGDISFALEGIHRRDFCSWIKRKQATRRRLRTNGR